MSYQRIDSRYAHNSSYSATRSAFVPVDMPVFVQGGAFKLQVGEEVKYMSPWLYQPCIYIPAERFDALQWMNSDGSSAAVPDD